MGGRAGGPASGWSVSYCRLAYVFICLHVWFPACLFVLAHGLLSCVSAVFGVCSSGLWAGGVGGGGG